MGTIGSFGKEITFTVSGGETLTFSGLTQKISGKYAKHGTIGQKDKAEFTGPGNRSLSLKITLDASLGVKPAKTMKKLEEAVESGKAEYFIVGGRAISGNKFFISSMTEAIETVLSRGEIARATLSMTLEEYT